MKNNQFLKIIWGSLALCLSSSLGLVQVPASAAKPLVVKFYCGQSFSAGVNKVLPTTLIATSARSEPVAFIQWKSTAYGKYPPQKRCAIVSPKLQRAWERKQLNYLIAGKLDRTGQGLICGASRKTKCSESNMLFMLNSQNEAYEIIDRIRTIQGGKKSNPILQGSGEEAVELRAIIEQSN